MSDNIKLSDQLGAMAIIDDLYQQQMMLVEHLDHATLRKNIAQKIKDYYLSRGLSIEDELIDAGVKTWFENRLRFDAPKTTWFQRQLARAYIKRGSAGKVIGVVTLAVMLLWGGKYYIQAQRTEFIAKGMAFQSKDIITKTENAIQLRSRYEQLSKQKARYTAPLISKLQTSYLSSIEQVNFQNILSIGTPLKLTSLTSGEPVKAGFNNLKYGSQEEGTELVAKLTKFNAELTENTQNSQEALELWQQVIEQDRQLSAIENKSDFARLYNSNVKFKNAFNSAKSSLQTSGVGDIAALEGMYLQTEQALGKQQEVNQLLSQIKAAGVPDQDMGAVNATAESAIRAFGAMDAAAGQGYIDQLYYYNDLASRRLTLMVVDRVGEKSGVQRTYDSSGGNAWYLVVEAVTPNGEVFPMRITDSETGTIKTVDTFAIRVKQSEFNRVRSDKMDDGHLSQRNIGDKPVGRLSFTYDRPVMDGMITEW